MFNYSLEQTDWAAFNKRADNQKELGDPLAGVRLDLSVDYEPLDFLLYRNGVGCIPRGDLQVIGGKAKSGKSTAALCMMAALLKGLFMGFTAARNDYRVLWVDTEMGARNVAERVKMVHELIGWDASTNNERLQVLTLRPYSWEDRCKYLEVAITAYRPDFILLDGVVDLCGDFMDSKQSKDTIELLMRLSSENDCAIMNILHVNKADANFRGHLGTEILNKCSEAYVCTRKDGTCEISQTDSRNVAVDKWAFTFGDVPAPVSMLSKTDTKKNELSDLFSKVFAERTSYKYTELCSKIIEVSGVSRSMAKKKVSEALQEGIISKDAAESKYYFCDFLGVENHEYLDNIF